MPDSDSEAQEKLRALFRKIVLNDTLLRVLDGASDPSDNDDKDFFNLCKIFVKYQKRFYDNIPGLSFEDEGFLIGSPWHGEPLKAKVLFVGSNPNLTRRCWFPRFHKEDGSFTGSFTLGGRKASEYVAVPGSRVKLKNSIDISEAQEFLTQRFQTTKINKKNGYLNAWLVKKDGKSLAGKPGGVSYWRGLYSEMKKFLHDNGPDNEAHAREIMAEVLSAEVVPFGSVDENPLSEPVLRKKGIEDRDKLLAYCWGEFIVPLIEYSAVETVYLVGAIAKRACKEYQRKNSKYVHVNKSGKKIEFVKIGHLSVH
ncbi:MAG: hypothetical protein IJR85_06920 [Synergistaceae bacterium]|nr:hypothetical protein [Synergistaceae bacterium]